MTECDGDVWHARCLERAWFGAQDNRDARSEQRACRTPMKGTLTKPRVNTNARGIFQADHPWDRAYHVLWVFLAWAVLIAGFGPGSIGHLKGTRAAEPPIVDVHAPVFSLWVLLVSVQIGLIRFKRPRTHARLGVAGVVLGVAVVVLGVGVAVTMARLKFENTHDPLSFQRLFHQLMDMALFGSFLWVGLVKRRDPATHKRLVLLATTVLLGAAFSRVVAPRVGALQAMLPAGWESVAYFAVWYAGVGVFMAGAAGYDVLSRGRVHAANVWGILIVVVCQIVVTGVVLYVPGWSEMARSALLGE